MYSAFALTRVRWTWSRTKWTPVSMSTPRSWTWHGHEVFGKTWRGHGYGHGVQPVSIELWFISFDWNQNSHVQSTICIKISRQQSRLQIENWFLFYGFGRLKTKWLLGKSMQVTSQFLMTSALCHTVYAQLLDTRFRHSENHFQCPFNQWKSLDSKFMLSIFQWELQFLISEKNY